MNFIVDPITNTKYAIHSTKGLYVLKQYIKLYQYGGSEDATSEPETEPESEPEPEPGDTMIARLRQLILQMYQLNQTILIQRHVCDDTARTYYHLLDAAPGFGELNRAFVNDELDPGQNYKMYINIAFHGGIEPNEMNDDHHNCVVVLYNEHAYIIGSWIDLFPMTIITRPRGEFIDFINRAGDDVFNFEEFEGFFIPANIRGRYMDLLIQGGYLGNNHNNYEAFTGERDDIDPALYFRFAELVKFINHSEGDLHIEINDNIV